MRANVLLVSIAVILVEQTPSPALLAQAATPKAMFPRAADAIERVSWRTRTLVGDDRLTNWNFAIATQTLSTTTFFDGVVRAEAAVVDFVEGSSAQRVSSQIAKPLDANLTTAERAALKESMGPVRLLSYRVETLPADAAGQRRLFEFAQEMTIDTLVVPAGADVAALDPLATEFGVNVAVASDSAEVVKALANRSKRVGVAIHTGTWAQSGTSVREGLARVKDRLLHVTLGDRAARGANGRNVPLGQGVGELTTFFDELNRLNIRPLVLSLDTTGVVSAPADLFRLVDAFEGVVQPAYGVHFTAFSRSRPIRRDLARPARGETPSNTEIERRSAEVLQQIRAAIPQKPYAPPKKARKLLVVESLQGMSHDTIPHTNVMLEEMGKITGAWTTVFSNDLNNLKYPAVKEYDAIFLNSIVGEFAPDPAVREGLLRFVREGGGIGGVHGTPWASRNWDEFGRVFGAKSAPHRIEQGVMKVYDSSSPLVKPLGEQPLNFREEYYRFEHEGPNRLHWEDVRVLVTVDLDDPKIEPRPWTGYKRPDNVYPVTWIRRYGNGRMFYSSLGHMVETFTTPSLVGHFLAGVQYMLGDLEADATPNPRTPKTQ
jgi:type 1 glutamine amidotransferase/sugar phosphate isomerase/epimerase